MIEEVKRYTLEFLEEEKSGHGMDHALRVFYLASKFALVEGADIQVVGIAALIHDVDDYKIVGDAKSLDLLNAKKIMDKAEVPMQIQEMVLNIIKNMGYKNYLKGIRPKTLEGMIVSDADMCEAIGAHGIIRSVVYAVSDKGSGVIFDKNVWPNVNMTFDDYNKNGTTYDTDNAINYCFEKMLKLKDLMLCKSGKFEAEKRHQFIIDFLKQFFMEEQELDWLNYLDNYLEELN
ncbi:MAG: HD domain-containing protein [Bacilli bacterium]|jgi:uncharacterized protein|nr:HD domain-containing protein [Bacilli bacterium]